MKNGEIFRTGTYAELIVDDEINQMIRKLENDTSPIESTSGSSNVNDDEMSSTTSTDDEKEMAKSVHSRKKSRVSVKKVC